MDLRKRVGKAFQALTSPEVKPAKKQKGYPQLGAGFLDLSRNSLAGDKSISDKLLKSFQGWVYANVSVLAEEISKMEFQLYTTRIVGGEIEWKEIDSHPLLDLLDRFNPYTTTSEAMYLTEAHLELAGDTFYLLDNATNPKNIFILEPDKVTVVPGEAEDDYRIVKYEYKPGGKKGDMVTYDADLVIHIKTPNPTNPYRGKSVVEAAAIDIDTDNLAGEMLKAFFRNGAVPNFALASDQRITRDDVARVQADLRANYSGPLKAFKTMILGGGLKPVPVQMSNKETQFLEIEMAMRDKIMALFKNTKASLGIVEDVNRANAEATLLSWKQSVIKPKMQRIVDTLNEFLVPRFGKNLILTFVNPVPEDVNSKVEGVTQLMNNQVRPFITVNEARDMLELEPLKGEEFDTIEGPQPILQPLPDKSFPVQIKNVDYRAHLRRAGIPEQLELDRNIRQIAKKLLTKQAKKVKEAQRYSFVTNEVANQYWAKQIAIAEAVETRFANRIQKFIEGLEEKALANLSNTIPKTGKKKAFDLFDVDAEITAGINLFTPLAEEIAALAGTEAYTLLKLNTLYRPTDDLKKRVATAVAEFTESFVKTDRDKLTAILASGLEQGESVAQIERRLRDQFSDFGKNQSVKIARTETLRAANAGALDAFKQSGVVEGKQWFTARDGNVDAECDELDGKIVALESDFFATDYGSGEEPPLHPNCRCVLLPVLVGRSG